MSRWEVNEVFDYPHLTISFGQLRVKLKQNSFVVPLFSIKIHWFTPRDCLKNKDNKWLILLNKIKQGTKIRIDRYIYINPDFSSFFSSDLHQMPKVCAPSPMAIKFQISFSFLKLAWWRCFHPLSQKRQCNYSHHFLPAAPDSLQ